MNPTSLHDAKIPGFKVVPRRSLSACFSPSQSAYYILLRRRSTRHARHERILFVHYLDHFLDGCEQQIDALWQKHRVLITHVAVKLKRRLRRSSPDFTKAYQRALTVQQLRQKLHPLFRRI
ncbi:MAG: hypothetical protein RIQ93_3406 [Verrucomicrobiota bacterium]|jgi:hypothetical protein